ncbi:PREDICTED: HAUS augmin-like complex subunit 3 [Eufriesea mexicana]|uniref:HAUS augmin-like complex subunit 3 n=1 Tax=Eufriesea mexicana TaxID=516756 RepID=UPI00083BFD84|nr:PREDICTED: HAUS augmin-like complex subunit 3 [Eufriesea mexicana]
MSVSGKTLYNKVCGLRPELSNLITPELLDKICDEPVVQPFLKWFCENLNYVNVVSDEDLQIMKKLQDTNMWLEGSELDHALEEATKDAPDLLKIVSFDDTDINDLFAEFEILKESHKEDENYIYTLQNGIQNLKKLEIKLDEDIEKEEECLNRETIEANKAYEDCFEILRQFDIRNHEFFKEVKHLLNIYADAAENKGTPLLWTQMPLELFIKKIELYNQYLHVHIKREFGSVPEKEQSTDSDYIYLISNSGKKNLNNEELQELALCKTNLTNAKMEKILAKIEEKSWSAVFNYIKDIYNLGNLKVPSPLELSTEILTLTKRRDFLEENVNLLQQNQLTELVQQFSEREITKILRHDMQSRHKEKKNCLEKLKTLLFLVRENGHVSTDLLRILMEIQFSRLRVISEFVADAYHYLATEYSLSTKRCENMKLQQKEYFATILSSPNMHNSFHKLFVSMVCNGDNTQQLNSMLSKYNTLMDENKSKKHFTMETYLNSKISKLEMLQNEINVQYLNEIQKEHTHTFKAVSHEIETCYDETFSNLQDIQIDLRKIRSQIKEQLETNTSYEREKNILWQRFLMDPDTLRKIHQEVKHATNKSCFDNT